MCACVYVCVWAHARICVCVRANVCFGRGCTQLFASTVSFTNVCGIAHLVVTIVEELDAQFGCGAVDVVVVPA